MRQPTPWLIHTLGPLSQVFHSCPQTNQTIPALRLRESYIFQWNNHRFDGEVRRVVSVQFRRVLVEIGLPAWCISFVLVLNNNQLCWLGVPFGQVVQSYVLPSFPSDSTFHDPECYVHSGALLRALVDYPEHTTDEGCYHNLVKDKYCDRLYHKDLPSTADLRAAFKIVSTTKVVDPPFNGLSRIEKSEWVEMGLGEGFLLDDDSGETEYMGLLSGTVSEKWHVGH